MTHLCHASFCQAPCRPQHLMCAKHWAMVPGRVKDRVCSAYRVGQCDDMRPTPAWFDAAYLAIAHVAMQESKPMSKRHRELLAADQGDQP